MPHRPRLLVPLFLLPLWAWGCGPTITASFDSPEPAARNSAIVHAAQTRDRSAIPDLVRMLDSDDPATRLLAINALERITGETRGYDYAAPEYRRQGAVEEWQRWVQEHMPEATSPTCKGVEGFGGVPHD